MTPLEAELRALGVGRNWDAATWRRYRAWAKANPRGGRACNGDEPARPRKDKETK